MPTAFQRVNQLRKMFDHDDQLLILIEPDPDSIASAMALKRLLWNYVQKCVISYPGEIQRLENQAMVELLKIPLVKFDKIDPDSFNRKAIIDSQPHHQEIFSMIHYDVIIDHHPIVKKLVAPFVDVRPDYGATATIMTDYLRGAKIKLSERLATALMYAIKTDTDNFERDASLEDIEQFRYVFRYVNQNLLRKIEQSEMRIDDLAFYHKALKHMIIEKKRVFVYLGKVETPDICVHIADFFMRVHMISWSFVAGLFNNKLIVILRSDGIKKDAGRFAMKVFEHYGVAGGHKVAARAEIPIHVLKESMKRINDRQIEGFLKKCLAF